MKSAAANTEKSSEKGLLNKDKIVNGLSRFAIPIALGVLIIIFSIMSNSFLTSRKTDQS